MRPLIILPGKASGEWPVVRFLQIVKTAHSRARTERTLLYGVDSRNPSLRLSLYRCYTQVIMLASTDAFPVVGGGCTGRAHRCKAKQGRRGKTTLTFELSFTLVRFFGRRREAKKILQAVESPVIAWKALQAARNSAAAFADQLIAEVCFASGGVITFDKAFSRKPGVRRSK